MDKDGKYLPGREDDPRFFARYPFYLPCLVASLFNLSAIILGTFCLEETLGQGGTPGQPTPPPAEPSSPPAAASPTKDYGTLPRSKSDLPRRRDVPGSLAAEAEAQRERRTVSTEDVQRQRKLSTERRLSSLYQDGEQNEGSALSVAALSRLNQSTGRRSSALGLVLGRREEPHSPLHVHSPGHYFHERRASGSHGPLVEGTAHGDEETQHEPTRLAAPPVSALLTGDVVSVISSQVRLCSALAFYELVFFFLSSACVLLLDFWLIVRPSRLCADAAQLAQCRLHGHYPLVLLHQGTTWWDWLSPFGHW